MVRIIGGYMGKYITVSVKIPVEVKKRLEELGIKPSQLLKKAIKDEIKRREMMKIQDEIREMRNILNKFTIDEIVESIREDRDSK